MKKRNIIICIITILIIIFIYFIFSIESEKSKNNETYHRSELEIISEYNEYILAVDKSYSEMNTYAIFINKDYENYEKLFAIEDEGFTLEKRFIVWNSQNIYILGYNPKAYNLNNGSVQYETDLLSLCNGKHCNFTKVIGIDDKYIYYSASYNSEMYYGKTSLDLSEITIITSDDIPSNLKR